MLTMCTVTLSFFSKCVTAHAAPQMVKLKSVSCVRQEGDDKTVLTGEKILPS